MKRLLPILLLIFSPAADAESTAEQSGINQMLNRAPSGSDLLLELHQFDVFQQNITDSADKRGDDAVKKFAIAQADAADNRDTALKQLQKAAGLDVTFSDQPSQTRDDRLGGLDGAVGPKYIERFYEAELAEHQSAMSLLQRYLTQPDNDNIRRFAEKQLPVLETGMKRLQAAAHP